MPKRTSPPWPNPSPQAFRLPVSTATPDASPRTARPRPGTHGKNDSRKIRNSPTGMIHGTTRGLIQTVQVRVYSPGGGGGAASRGTGGGAGDARGGGSAGRR